MAVTENYGTKVLRHENYVAFLPEPPPTLLERIDRVAWPIIRAAVVCGIVAAGVVMNPPVFIGVFLASFLLTLLAARSS